MSALIALSAVAVAQQAVTPSKDVPTIAHDARPAVVRIVLYDQTGKELGSGSGFVVTSDGKVITNYHVIHISDTAQAEVRFTDGAAYQVQGVIATDPDRDLAVLKLKSVDREFVALHFGDSDRVQVGEHVIAIGSPLAGLSAVSTEDTVSDGIVSGIRDWPNEKMKVFQITAPLSPGSSGGVLMNTNGDVIGVTFAQLTEGQNLNFAIPVAYVRPMLVDSPPTPLAATQTKSASEQTGGPATVSTEGLAGSYTGVWQSGRFSVSGAAAMTVRMEGNAVTAEIFLTGGEVTSANLTGIATKTGESIWTTELSSKHPKLSVRAVFRNGTFVGDYKYNRFLLEDRGQWILRKEQR